MQLLRRVLRGLSLELVLRELHIGWHVLLRSILLLHLALGELILGIYHHVLLMLVISHVVVIHAHVVVTHLGLLSSKIGLHVYEQLGSI